jgi:DNA-binding NtrC family response regulator
MPVIPSRSSRPTPAAPDYEAAVGDDPGSTVVLNSYNVADAERHLIEHALVASQGNRTRAAELLGISVRTLRNKLNAPADDEQVADV